MKNPRRLLLLWSLLFMSLWAIPALARFPRGKLVMLDVSRLANVTSRHPTDDTHLSWREIVAAGINGVHLRSWTFSGDGSYSQREWIREAHEHGLWVCGGTGNSQEQMQSDAALLASLGVDFIQLDEPMQWASLTENGYHAIRAAARAVNAEIPVVITDVFYNDVISGWSNVDGLMQEVYVDQWYPGNIDQAVQYRDSHPGQGVFIWVWLLTKHPDQCLAYPDSKFDTWFNDSFSRLGQVLLFIFNRRDGADPANCEEGTNWPARVATIQAATAGLRVNLPRFRNFSPADPVDDEAPDCSVEVRSAGAGLDPNSVECHYSTDGGLTWNRWLEVSCSGGNGSTSWETITARHVPFAQVSSELNQIRFSIRDNYSGNYYRGPRRETAVYTVRISGRRWGQLQPAGPLAELAPDLSVTVRDQSAGLAVDTAAAEYSSDGGLSWRDWPASCSGVAGSTATETVVVSAVPFNQESLLLNKIRFRIENQAGRQLVSPVYDVPVVMAPSWADFQPPYTRNLQPDCSVVVQDPGGLAVGSSELAVSPETVLLLHLDGDLGDASADARRVQGGGNLQWRQIDTWKSQGGQEQMLHFDGTDDYCAVDALNVGGPELTVLAWVWAENEQEAIAYGGVEEPGSLIMRFRSDRVALSGRASGSNFGLNSPAGTFSSGAWHQVAAVVQGEDVSLYIDGLRQGQKTWAGYRVRPTADFSLGRALNRMRFFSGYLDEVALLRRALSADEVAAAYYSGQYRYSRDGGVTWESEWLPCNLDTTTPGTTQLSLLAPAIDFGQYSDTLNRVAFQVRDLQGNLTRQEFTVWITEEDPCADRECGGVCGECPPGSTCVDGACREVEGGKPDGASTDDGGTDGGGSDDEVMPDGGEVAGAGGGCGCGHSSSPGRLPLLLLGLLVSCRRLRRRR